MKLISALTLVMFTLKLLGLFAHGWLVVFSPVLFVYTVAALASVLTAILER